MASNERNALAELAEVLAWFVDESQDNERVPTMQLPEAINKAHRIIAELAKVPVSSDVIQKGDLEISIVHSYQSKCLSKCRAIAEEGAKK